MEYRIAVQCKDTETGQVATFIRNENRTAISPLFPDLAGLYPWMRDSGWKSDEGYGDNFQPWRVVRV
jgi:hypothetical protein